jgi:serine/threonine-protein kinase ULK/ATG1
VFQKEHRDTLAKLQFVQQLVDSLMSLASSRGSTLALMLQSRGAGGPDGANANTDAYRRVEQLVVYVRALHMLSSALQLAQQHVANKTLLPSAAVRTGAWCTHVRSRVRDCSVKRIE